MIEKSNQSVVKADDWNFLATHVLSLKQFTKNIG